MDTLARKIIDAIQNSLVGDLVWKLVWPFGYLWAQLTSEVVYSETYGPVFQSWLLVALLGASAIWFLGTIAKKSTRLRSVKYLSDRVTRQPENGFETWSSPPADGLRPPAFMRRIVMMLGGSTPSSNPRLGWLPFTLLIAAMLVAMSVAWLPAFWADLNPLLAQRGPQIIIVQACFVVIFASEVRRWATDQKQRLAAQDQALVTASLATS